MYGDATKREGSSAVLLVGHGTREATGLEEFERLAEAVGRRVSGQHVQRAFLELAEPSIPEAIDSLAAEGTTSVRIVPLLLFAAGHAKRDIPAAVEEASRRHPGLRVELAPALACDDEILALSARRFDEALAGRAPVPRERTMLLLVGRGTSDAEAIDEVRRFAAMRCGQSGVACADVCFVAAAQPSLAEGLKIAAEAKYPRVVVQPHLLFAGQVLDEIHMGVKSIERKSTGIEWILTGHLGPEEELVRAVVRRAN